VKQDLADFKPMEAGGFLIGDDGSLGGFEALRLIRFVFRGVVGRWRRQRMLAVAREGDLSPRWGWFSMWGRNPALTRWATV
jgi:hypothetical protein